jgi:heat shock 70kDa protein 1/2/6/8
MRSSSLWVIRAILICIELCDAIKRCVRSQLSGESLRNQPSSTAIHFSFFPAHHSHSLSHSSQSILLSCHGNREGSAESSDGSSRKAETESKRLGLNLQLKRQSERSFSDEKKKSFLLKHKAKATEVKVAAKEVKYRSVGIDLGTTNSAVSVIECGLPIIIPVDGLRITPSIVMYGNPQSNKHLQPSQSQLNATIVGAEAKQQLLLNPKNTFSSVKRLMGEGAASPGSKEKEIDPLTKLKLNPAKNGHSIRDKLLRSKMSDLRTALASSHSDSDDDAVRFVELAQNLTIAGNADSKQTSRSRLRCPALDRDLSPEEISSQILRKLLDGAASYLGHPVKRAVVTVPAYFSKEQCQATERAGMMAGLDKVKLLREPEAAALAYGLTRMKPQIVLVFDLGGGTFDVSILEVGGGFVEVIATSGDSHLGGDDFDAAIARWIIEQIIMQNDDAASQVISPHKNGSQGRKASSSELSSLIKKSPALLTKIYVAAEKTKVDLSLSSNATIIIDFSEVAEFNKIFELILTRSKFESLTKALLQRILRPLREAAVTAGVNLPGDSGQVGIDEFSENINWSAEMTDAESDRTLAAMKKKETEGRQLAKLRQKTAGKSVQELRRLQRERGDSSIALFPGGQVLDDVILVGGATRMPSVQRLVRTITGITPKQSVNVDEAVSLGAAVMAGILDGDITDMQVMNAWQAAMYRTLVEGGLLPAGGGRSPQPRAESKMRKERMKEEDT